MADQNHTKTTKHRAMSSSAVVDDDGPPGTPSAGPMGAPCGACKFLRRKCVSGCVFAPHFGSDQGSARFAAVHKVFGASNVSKLLQHIPMNRRNDAVMTICYEAQARLSDPVYGCVSTIFALQQQVASLQAELALTQSRLMNSRMAAASAFPQQQQQQQQIAMLQPTYSNNSTASTNLLNMNSFNSNFDFTNETASVQLSLPCQQDDQDDEEESANPMVSFANQNILHHR